MLLFYPTAIPSNLTGSMPPALGKEILYEQGREQSVQLWRCQIRGTVNCKIKNKLLIAILHYLGIPPQHCTKRTQREISLLPIFPRLSHFKEKREMWRFLAAEWPRLESNGESFIRFPPTDGRGPDSGRNSIPFRNAPRSFKSRCSDEFEVRDSP